MDRRRTCRRVDEPMRIDVLDTVEAIDDVVACAAQAATDVGEHAVRGASAGAARAVAA